MMPTVNLYIDRMNPVEPVRVADVYAATQDRSSSYKEAAVKIGLTTREYAEFRQALQDGGAVYVRLPRRIDEMAGVHRNGHVYALRNVVVPAGTMGWTVNLADGTQVIVPQICSNLSMNRSHPAIAHIAPPPKHQAKRVAAAHYVHAAPAAVVETPVVFTPPVSVAPVASAATDSAYVAAPAGAAAVAAGHSALPFLGLLAPVIAAFANATHGGPAPSAPVPIAPCSAGSNAMGVCQTR